MRLISAFSLTLLVVLPYFVSAQPARAELEPELNGDGVIQLISDQSFDGWKVPSTRWSIEGGVITGDTMGEKLPIPEWLYSTETFENFIFSAEVRLSGGPRANSGIYFRVQPFTFKRGKSGNQYEAPSGYEFDAALSGKHNGSLGDWYARPKLRINPDPKVMEKIFKAEDWNRMTIRARGNRIEYWLNGTKIIDYTDNDPQRSPKGLIGLQIHDKLVMKVELKNALLLPLGEEEG